MNWLRQRHSRILVLLFALAIPASLFLFLIDTVLFYWTTPYVIGWDGTGHATIAKVYAETIFPATWGWIDTWYTGMPFPQFYPPLFYFFFACLYLSTQFEYMALFKTVVITLVFGIPPLLMWITHAYTKRTYPTITAGIISGILILTDFQYTLGIDFISSLYTGLVTQLFAFYIFIFWLRNFLSKKWVTSTILLALLALANAHMVPVVLFFYIASFAYDIWNERSKRVAYPYVASGVIAIGITAFWSFPMLWYSDFLLTKAISLPSVFAFIQQHVLLFGTSLVGLLISILKKNSYLFIPTASVFGLIFINIFLSFEVSTGLPLHLYRWLGPMLMIVPFIIAYALHLVLAHAPKKYIGSIYTACALSFILFTPIAADTVLSSKGVTNLEEIPALLALSQKLEGRIVVEGTSYSGSQTSFVIEGLLGAQGNTGTISVFRESSINALFFIPVRNTISTDKELWGFDSFLNGRESFFLQEPREHVDRLIRFNIAHVVVRSKRVKDILEADPRVSLHGSVDKWNIYTITPTSPDAMDVITQLSEPPIALYAALGWTARQPEEITWARVQEEVLYTSSNVHFISPNDQTIDTSPSLDEFPISVIASYEFKDLNAAISRLTSTSSMKKLYLIDDGSETARFFIESLQHLPHTTVVRSSEKDAEATIHSLLLSLENDLSDEALTSNTKNQYYFIKKSFFPALQNGGTLYLATPGFIVSDVPNIPVLAIPPIVYISYGISLISLFILVVTRKRIAALSSSKHVSPRNTEKLI